MVLDNSNTPIEGVTASIEGTTLQAITDDQGHFTIRNVPVGAQILLVDGSTTTRPGVWPTLEFEISTIAGQDNTIGMPIFLLPLDAPNAQTVGGSQDVTVTMKDVPGFALTVFADSATFSDGSTVGEVMVTQVHSDKVPMPPIEGAAPRLVWTVQPAGVLFDPRARITYPNLDNLKPGQVVDIFSFDHDLGEFVSIGTGTVSEDGSVITSDPGVGIRKAGWGYPQPPPEPTDCAKSADVKITSSPGFLTVGKDETIQAEGSLATSTPGCPAVSGTFEWVSDNPAVVTVSGTGSTATLTGVAVGTASVSVTYTVGGQEPVTASEEIKVATKDVTVIAWVDGSPIDMILSALEADPKLNRTLKFNLDTPGLCSVQLGNWAIGLRTSILSDTDRQFANAFLLKNSANSRPENTIDPDAIETGGDFRLFNRFQVFFQVQNGQIVGQPDVRKMVTEVGSTRDPCGLIPPSGGEDHPQFNGANGITTSGTGVFQLNEGRIGFAGQAVDRTLNACQDFNCINITIGPPTPWIWSVIKFDAQGNRTPVESQIFPTYFVYENGVKVAESIQSDPEVFIGKDSSNSEKTDQID